VGHPSPRLVAIRRLRRDRSGRERMAESGEQWTKFFSTARIERIRYVGVVGKAPKATYRSGGRYRFSGRRPFRAEVEFRVRLRPGLWISSLTTAWTSSPDCACSTRRQGGGSHGASDLAPVPAGGCGVSSASSIGNVAALAALPFHETYKKLTPNQPYASCRDGRTSIVSQGLSDGHDMMF